MAKCIELGLDSVCFESDSSQLINAINEVKIPLEVYGVVSDIILLSSRFISVSFYWINRDVNAVADNLAKQCLVVAEAFMAET
uniref:RNase H type-1 domain-containing protein n=1 Tax=Brassica oleracea TaxID=3712 RepID=A0A3P6EP48_BRAOL|nr:unnamed protein product [Brassica oleracea]